MAGQTSGGDGTPRDTGDAGRRDRERRPDPERALERLLDASGVRFEGFSVGGRHVRPADIVDVLGETMTPERRDRIDRVVAGRTYAIATVVEGLANTGNVSAVMRTAEGLGFQAIHVVSGEARLKHSRRTTQGAHKWLDVYEWDTPGACCEHLRSRGYRIVVSLIGPEAREVSDVDWTRPSAVVFGNELEGVSDEMLAEADLTCILPAPGFVQSYNISVAAAMVLYEAYRRRTVELGASGDLTPEESIRLRADFYMRATANAESILGRAFE